MVSLWGSKQNGEQGEDESSQNRPGSSSDGEHPQPATHSRRQADPDERTRLLPPPAGHGGYLSPDDPAVRTSRPS
jgi:hypothetical protein